MYDSDVVAAADRVADQALQDFLAQPGTNRAVVTRAVAGAGKTHFIVTGVGASRRSGLRVAICTPTNDQAFALVRTLSERLPRERITYVPAARIQPPASLTQLPNVVIVPQANQAHGAAIVVGTFDKLGDAFARGDLDTYDVLLADESFQADSTRYYKVTDLAPTHLLVGDPGQLSPFSTVEEDRWRGLLEDPLQTAVGILLRNHPSTAVYRLPITRRLDSRAVPVARSFYPGHEFHAAVLPGVRRLRLLPSAAVDHPTRVLDHALEMAATSGWAHLELPDAAVLTADPDAIALIVNLIRRLSERGPEVRCERESQWIRLDPRRIAIGVSHNDQKDLLGVELSRAGFPDVVVSTANKLQGGEFDLVIAWHPLAGLPEADGFHLDPGRLCVLLTRHRHACIVVGRAGDRVLTEAVPPSTPAYLGWDPDPVLNGWDVHRSVFKQLELYRITA